MNLLCLETAIQGHFLWDIEVSPVKCFTVYTIVQCDLGSLLCHIKHTSTGVLSLFYHILQVDFDHTNIIVTEPYFNFPSVQEGMSEIFLRIINSNQYFGVIVSLLLLELHDADETTHIFCDTMWLFT